MRHPAAPAVPLLLAALVSCSAPPGSGAATTGPSVDPPMSGMHDVMQAKLLHAHALLEAVAMEDLAAVEQNAEALTVISERSEFRVHLTEAYAAYSLRFRDVTRSMAAHAREGNLDAIALDYVQMTHSCLNCHTYLRREGLIRDMPGEQS